MVEETAVQIDTLSVGELTIGKHEIFRLPRTFYAGSASFKPSGLLGNDFLSQLPFTINYQNSTITFYDAAHFQPPVNEHVEDFEIKDQSPFVKGIIAGQSETWFLLDTGQYNGVVLPKSLWKNRGEANNIDHPVQFHDIFDRIDTAQGQLPSLAIFGTTLKKVPVVLLNIGRKSGTLGGGVLKNFRITFDYRHKKLWTKLLPKQSLDLIKSPSFDVNTKDLHGSTPLMEAVDDGRVDLIKALLDRDADINAKDILGRFPLFQAVSNGDLSIVNLLLIHGADVNENRNDGVTSLMVAAQQGYLEILKGLLKKGAHIDAFDHDGQTALMLATLKGHTEVLKTLISSNAKVNTKNSFGATPLFLAVREEHIDAVQILLNHGAEINDPEAPPLILAVTNEKENILNALLEKGADVNIKSLLGQTALMIAAYKGHVSTLRLLLKKGAKPELKDRDGNTALDFATERKHKECIELLKASLKDPKGKNY